MDKQTAQQTLEQLQKSIADAQRQAKELQAIIDKPDVSLFYKGRLVALPGENAVTTFYLDAETTVRESITRTPTRVSPNGKRFDAGLTFASAKSAADYLDYLKVRQKARVAMAAAWGDEAPKWDGCSPNKYCVVYTGNDGGQAKIDVYQYTWQPIHFPTKSSAEAFLHSLTNIEAQLLFTGM